MTAIASYISIHVSRRVEEADVFELETLRKWLFSEMIVTSIVFGAGFWWIGIEGTQQALFAITIIACLYATGSMVNLSTDFRSFVYCGVLNLGQGVLLFSGIVVDKYHPEIAVSIAAVLFLLISFARENARQFADTIKIRAENIALVEQLAHEKGVVEEALGTAQEAYRDKSRFLAAASHDLRQPLHAMGLFLGSLSMMVEGAEARKLLRRIRETTDVLTSHFNSLLDISRFDAGGIEVERADFSISALLKTAVDEFRPQAEEKGLAISLNADDSIVYSDEVLVDRVIRNLLSNAVRYTEKGSVNVVAEKKGDHVDVSIIDTGPGIAHEEQKDIFNEFVQLNNPARRREQGVGLGLAIVKRIDSLLGLSLRLRSSEGVGSRFEILLPLADDDVKQADSSQEQREADIQHASIPAGLNVWVLEDDKAAADALCMQLEAWNCNVTLATTRQELETEHAKTGVWPDVVLLDDMLGTGESGLEIAEWLSSHMPKEQVVMVTGNTAPERLNEIANKGFPLILKPMSSQRLLTVLTS
jgi:signal transduction histidine kinase/CheY-like chemotaxis protein